MDPQAGLTLAEVNAQTTFIEAYGVKVGMEEFDKVFNEPKVNQLLYLFQPQHGCAVALRPLPPIPKACIELCFRACFILHGHEPFSCCIYLNLMNLWWQAWTNDERLLVAKAANAILAERVGPEGLNLRPAPQALGAIYDSLRGPSWKMNEPGWKPSERTSGVSAWHGVEVSGAPENANGLMSVLGDAFLGEGTFTIQDQPIVALRLPNNQLTGSASTGLLQPLAKLQASGDTSAALATINVAGNALTGDRTRLV